LFQILSIRLKIFNFNMYPPLLMSSDVILSGPGALFPFSLQSMLLISLYVGISISSSSLPCRGAYIYTHTYTIFSSTATLLEPLDPEDGGTTPL
jgi:hypothetical protein